MYFLSRTLYLKIATTAYCHHCLMSSSPGGASQQHTSLKVSPLPPRSQATPDSGARHSDGSENRSDIDDRIVSLQQEMDRLRRRRQQLDEEQRRLLDQNTQERRRHADANASDSLNDSAHRMQVRLAHQRSVSARNQRGLVDHDPLILTEKQRIELLAKRQLDLKEQMRQSWEHDSTLVGGFFFLKSNPHVSTFGRAARFQPVVGQKGQYWLSRDMECLQSKDMKYNRPHLTASSRGREGTNVNSHWNDSKGGVAPGPGAYTPRFSQVCLPKS
jgi:hypothetical protein